jgi:hypothetical protein
MQSETLGLLVVHVAYGESLEHLGALIDGATVRYCGATTGT